MSDFLKYVPYLGALTAAGIGAVVILKRLRSFKIPAKPHRVCGQDYPRDTVVVHQMINGPYAPNLGNMVVKLETYMRFAEIPYETHVSPFNGLHGPKQKIPWIEYNGQEMGDSEIIIEFLNKEFNVDLDANLSRVQRAQARAIQKWVDEFTYWLIVYTRWVTLMDDWYDHVREQVGHVNKEFFRNRAKERGYIVGVGRHSKEEIEKFLEDDLVALSDLLGDQKYFMGDEPSRVDCAVFGQLTQLRWHTPDSCSGKRLLREKFANLNDYCLRIKEKFWPDWDKCCRNS